jgi:hypothetical protein
MILLIVELGEIVAVTDTGNTVILTDCTFEMSPLVAVMGIVTLLVAVPDNTPVVPPSVNPDRAVEVYVIAFDTGNRTAVFVMEFGTFE